MDKKKVFVVILIIAVAFVVYSYTQTTDQRAFEQALKDSLQSGYAAREIPKQAVYNPPSQQIIGSDHKLLQTWTPLNEINHPFAKAISQQSSLTVTPSSEKSSSTISNIILQKPVYKTDSLPGKVKSFAHTLINMKQTK